MNSETIARELGAISATLDNIKDAQKEQGETLHAVEDRLRKVETKGAVNGALTGGVMAVAVALIKDMFKS